MIGYRETTKLIRELRFRLPMDAREISDAILQVEEMRGHHRFDDRYRVTGDEEELIFYWVEDNQ